MKKILILIVFALLIPWSLVQAQTTEAIFEAEVVEIIDSRQVEREDGSSYIQQDVRLEAEGEWQDKEIISHGINDFDVANNVVVEVGDQAVVSYLQDIEGNENYYIIDVVRRSGLWWLLAIFCVLMILIGKSKGFKALISLGISVAIIFYLVIPGILAGYNPLLVSIVSSFLILTLIIYLTWGWQRQSHLGFISIALSLLITGFLAWLFANITSLTGFTSEDVTFLIGTNETPINFKGLLLAGIILGTLGVLDDVVVSQISTVKQLKETDNSLSWQQLYKRGMQVGVDHISSMTNTLFLAYAGVSLPLLLLFNLKTTAMNNWLQVINSEIIATEIVRTLVGSIGLILAVPIATFIAAKYFKKI